MTITTSSIPSIGTGGLLPTSASAKPSATATKISATSEDTATAAGTRPSASTRESALASSSTPASASATASASTSTSASISTATSNSTPRRPDGPASSSSQGGRRTGQPASPEFLSDKATAALIRRCLCARHLADRDRGRGSPAPIQDLLPPLTSRNDVDLQLYALLSIVLREFVQNWYNKITPDETFVAEVVQVIAHCTRALEQRLRKVDLESLLFDELPELLATHVRAYRTAARPGTKAPLKPDAHQIYHSLWPLPALSPVPQPGDQASIQAQADNESAYRQLLVHGVLAVLLPTEDLENECLTSLVSQILSELVIGNLLANKLSEPWLVWELLIMTTRLVHKRKDSGEAGTPANDHTAVRDSNSTDPSASPSMAGKRSWSLQQALWSVVHWVFLGAGMIRLTISLGALSLSLPPRPSPSAVRAAEMTDHDTSQLESQSSSDEVGIDTHTQPARIPVLEFHLWRCIGDILEVDTRMPWLRGTFSMMQWIALRGPGKVAALNGTLDRLMSHYIRIHVLDPAHLPPLLRAIRAALFPNNAPGVSSLKPPSSGEQLAALRRRCASALWGLLPRAVGEQYYGINQWPWSGVKACIITNEGVRPRTDPLKSTLSHHDTARLSGGADAESSHVPLAGGKYPVMRNNATLSPLRKRFSPGTDRLSSTRPGYNEDEMRTLAEIETGIVDIFSDAYCNKHLVYGILELVLLRLVPELAEKGVGELWEERLH
ncbi:PXA domain-containing protein [Nemania sp. FL0916]|nr:PXA domain-containing protein [Nemania sp. FL0916]